MLKNGTKQGLRSRSSWTVAPTFGGDHIAIRQTFEDTKLALAPFTPPPNPDIDREYRTIDGIPCRIYKPTKAPYKLPVGVYYHTGGFVCGDLEFAAGMCDFLAHRALDGCIIIDVDYRLAPEYMAPAAFEDSLRLFKWVAANAGSLGGDSNRLFVYGEGAGGTLALAVTAAIVAHESTRSTLKGCVAIAPVAVHRNNVPEKYQSWHTSYEDNSGLKGESIVLDAKSMEALFSIGGVDPDDPRYFPVLAADVHAKFPPTYICACGADPLRDDAVIMNDILKKACVRTRFRLYEGLPHFFWVMPGVSQAAQFMVDTFEGIRFVLL